MGGRATPATTMLWYADSVLSVVASNPKASATVQFRTDLSPNAATGSTDRAKVGLSFGNGDICEPLFDSKIVSLLLGIQGMNSTLAAEVRHLADHVPHGPFCFDYVDSEDLYAITPCEISDNSLPPRDRLRGR